MEVGHSPFIKNWYGCLKFTHRASETRIGHTVGVIIIKTLFLFENQIKIK